MHLTRALLGITVATAINFAVQLDARATALQFAGDGDRVNVPLPSLFSNIAGNDFTFTGRVRPDAFATSRVFYAQQDTSNFATVLLGSSGTLLFYVVSGGTTYSLTTSTAIAAGQWTHFGARWNASTNTVSLIVNGVAAGSYGGTSSTGTNGVFTLGTRTDGNQALNGAIDELTLWPSALSDSQIASDAAGLCIAGASAVLHYDFEVGTPDGNNAGLTTLPDISGNSSNGTLNGFALTGTTSNWVTSPYAGCVPPSDLSISLGAAPNPVIAGDSLTWTADVTNSGSAATNVTVNGEVPAGTTFVSLAPPSGFSCTTPAVGASGAVSCSIATLPVGGPATFSLVTQTDAGDAPNSTVNATWTVASVDDTNSANNSANAGATIANAVDLQGDSASTAFNQTTGDIDVLANDSVAAGGAALDPSTLAIAAAAANGIATCAPATGCSYTPTSGFTGIDGFSYQVCDSSPAPVCGTANVRIAVGPHAVANSFATPQDTALSASVAGNDVFPANSSFTKLADPAAGSVSVASDGSFTYVPNAAYVGGDTFTYGLCLPPPDAGVCDFASVDVTVLQANDRIFYDGFGM